jgi:molybdopterin-guanine dinucleotide biosynthesis protein A
MGRPKLSLPFGPELMLQRVVRILSEVVSPIVVVAAPEQDVPPLPNDVLVVRDEQEFLGPLAGLAAGLTALRPYVDVAYASGCDVPLLKPEFVRYVVDALGAYELAMPRDGQFHHSLAAAYRTALAERTRALVRQERLRPIFLLEESNGLEIDVADLRVVDPELQSLRNTNSPDDYQAALIAAGFVAELARVQTEF